MALSLYELHAASVIPDHLSHIHHLEVLWQDAFDKCVDDYLDAGELHEAEALALQRAIHAAKVAARKVFDDRWAARRQAA